MVIKYGSIWQVPAILEMMCLYYDRKGIIVIWLAWPQSLIQTFSFTIWKYMGAVSEIPVVVHLVAFQMCSNVTVPYNLWPGYKIKKSLSQQYFTQSYYSFIYF